MSFIIENGVLTEYRWEYGETKVVIPDGVTTIGDGAFHDCWDLTSITIPDSGTSIGMWAFAYCSGLTEITIPDSVTTIGSRAFEDCTSLKNLTIPSSVTDIGECAVGYKIDRVVSVGQDELEKDFTIHGKVGSAAETYAKTNNIPFIAG